MKITILTLVLTLITTGISQAQTLADALQACSTKIDNLARLTCFDKLANQPVKTSQANATVKTKPKMLPAPAAEKPVVTPPKKAMAISPRSQEQEFGLANKPAKTNTKISKVIATVSEVSKDPYGKLIISLDNQHVWKQNDSDSFRVRTGDQVYVEEGALNSFFLSKESVNKRIRVKRIK